MTHAAWVWLLKLFFLDLENWGEDYVEACEGLKLNAHNKNEQWWLKYKTQLGKFKQNMNKFAKCWLFIYCIYFA